MTTHWFLMVVEKANGKYSAYAPDLPGCVAAGETREEAEHDMHEAIAFHIEGMREDNLPIPEPLSSAAYVALP